MAELTLALCASHTPLMELARDAAPPQARDNFFAALRRLGELGVQPGLDALIVVSNEHFTNFFLDNFPQLCIGTAASHFGPSEPWLGIPQGMIPGHPPLARHVLEEAMQDGFEPAFSEELRLDHGIVDVYYELHDAMSTPLVPIIQNCGVAPMITPRRAFEFGRSIGRAVRSHRGTARVGIVGAGGLSHDIGTPRIGLIEPEFDRWFLDTLASGDIEDLLTLTDDEISEAGNGAHEIRSWLTVAGAMWPRRGTVRAYEPIEEWLTGMAVMEFVCPAEAVAA